LLKTGSVVMTTHRPRKNNTPSPVYQGAGIVVEVVKLRGVKNPIYRIYWLEQKAIGKHLCVSNFEEITKIT